MEFSRKIEDWLQNVTWLIEILDFKQGYTKLCLFWKINLRSSKYKATTLPQSYGQYLSKLISKISNSIHKFSEHVPIFILKLGHISPKLFWFKKIVRMLPCLVFIIVFKQSIENCTFFLVRYMFVAIWYGTSYARIMILHVLK